MDIIDRRKASSQKQG